MFFPCPYLGRDVVGDGRAGVAVYVFCHGEVEARVVDQHEHVGLPCAYVGFGLGHAAHDGAQVCHHGDEAHVGQCAVVSGHRASLGGHHVAADEAEVGGVVLLPDGVHEVCGVQVARCFAGYDIVAHVVVCASSVTPRCRRIASLASS